MSTIICPIDFSDTSVNAMKYAFQLAQKQDATVVVLHTLHVPAVDMYSSANVLTDVMEIQKEGAVDKLNVLLEKVGVSDVPYSLHVEFGLAVDVILQHVEEKGASSIVMGTRGHTDAVNRFLGSVSYHTVMRSDVPVLVIPSGQSFTSEVNIAFAHDLKSETKDSLKTIYDFFQFTKPDIKLFHVIEEDVDESTYSLIMQDGSLESYEVKSNHASDGIYDFTKAQESSVLVMKQNHKNLIQRLFTRNTIKEILSDVEVPVLVLP
jgi:nucleotide-binding universal stress UspA family protein